jgi:hypothetical protein
MDEHDDDLESEVHEDAEQETDDYPNTGDDLDEPLDLDEGDAPLDDESESAHECSSIRRRGTRLATAISQR